MKAGIVVFPGINRERDMAIALEAACGKKPRMVWHKDTDLSDLDLVVLPGGFSHGDYLRCGAMAAQSPVMAAVRSFAASGGYVLGVCNGFQILTEAGLLPGALLRNDGNYFADTETLDRLEGEGLVAFRYATANGVISPEANRNGSQRNIAGIYSPNLRILGLMPHPEDLVDPLMGGIDGKPLFDGLAAALTPFGVA